MWMTVSDCSKHFASQDEPEEVKKVRQEAEAELDAKVWVLRSRSRGL